MSNLKQLAIYAIVLLGMTVIDVKPAAESWAKSLTIYSQAEAVVGRPLTPVSVAGVTRRTVRRCATGVYYCKNKVIIPAKLPSTQKG